MKKLYRYEIALLILLLCVFLAGTGYRMAKYRQADARVFTLPAPAETPAQGAASADPSVVPAGEFTEANSDASPAVESAKANFEAGSAGESDIRPGDPTEAASDAAYTKESAGADSGAASANESLQPGPTRPPSYLFNLNTVDAAQLESLPGIGPAIAGRIISYRAEHGPFDTLEALMQVSGIGEALFSKVRDYLYVSPS